jgi:glucose/arabinose dehydrogenase
LTINTIGNGSVIQDNLDDKTIKLTAEPEVNYKFLNWSGDLNGTNNPIEIVLDRNKIITATFEVDDLLEIEVSDGGTYEKKIVSTENGVLIYDLRAVPASGYEFVHWKNGNEEFYTESITLQIEKETIISLDFADTSMPFDYNRTSLVDLNSEKIWGLDIVDNDHLIFTTKSGKIYAFKEEQLIKISSYYEGIVNSSGQGGLLDIKLDPNYQMNKYVYVTYSEKITGSNFSYISLDRFKYENAQISSVENIFKTSTPSQRNGHFGSRISFSNEYLFLSVGEGSPSLGGVDSQRQNAQDLSIDWGKIHRLNFDGTIPADNPFYNSDNSSKSIYSYGHRNPQGLMFDPYNLSIISTEHGPKGGDELNVIKKGLNYGWPLVSYGINYNGSDISGRTHEGYEKPVFYWDPSIATSQAILLKDKSHRSWFKNILVAGLKSASIHRLKSLNGVFQEVEKIELGYRVRSLCEGENGVIFVSNDNGGIEKFTPIE